MIIDSHCHLDYFEDGEIKEMLDLCKEDGIQNLLTISTKRSTMGKVIDIAQTYHNEYGVYCTLGVHPCETGSLDDVAEINGLLEISNKDRNIVIGIGETGLDYFKNENSPQHQQNMLEKHIEICLEHSLPIIIHSRDAEDDTYALLKQHPNLKILMHCFTGSKKLATQMLDLGAMISISGIVTFKNASHVQDIAKYIPDDRILVETDSPYLAPEPFRGKRNKPLYVTHVGKKVAELREIDYTSLCDITTANFSNLFGISQ